MMGAELVAEVLANHARIPDRSFRVLVRMALTALDRPREDRRRGGEVVPAAIYWAGWEPLALALGRHVPDPCGRGDSCRCEPCRTRRNAEETVRRAVAELVRRCIVVRIGQAHRGANTVYGLNLKGHRHGGPNGDTETTDSPSAAVPLHPTVAVPLSPRKPHRGGGESPTVAVPPRRKRGTKGNEEPSEDTHTPVPNPTRDRAWTTA